jgi:DNA-directed RNA polymerase specialized sigma subunit
MFEEAGNFSSRVEEQSLEEELHHYSIWLGFRSLTPYQQWIFSKKYSSGWKDTDIASHLQISRQAVSNAHRKGLKTLRFYAGK